MMVSPSVLFNTLIVRLIVIITVVSAVIATASEADCSFAGPPLKPRAPGKARAKRALAPKETFEEAQVRQRDQKQLRFLQGILEVP